jgi:N6-L-threonylcarbamoyladenine synthase
MRILGLESSCDETAAAVVDDGRILLSSVVTSQIDIHKMYGGVVPEIAARSHIEVVIPVIEQALAEAKTTWNEIDAIAVTKGPGLLGSLLIGSLTARTLALLKNKPLYGVDHVKAHAYVNWLLDEQPEFPVLALIVSGGHSQIVLFESHENYRLLGQTTDDAIGEAFDKVAKIIGLEYPGGPSIANAAELGDPHAYEFPSPRTENPYDMSFSGLKTAALRKTQAICGKDYTFPSFELAELLSEQQVNDLAASFQHRAIAYVVGKTKLAFEEFAPKSVIIGGGVAASKELRKQLSQALPIEVSYSPFEHCTDNAAMIATLGYYHAQSHQPEDAMIMEVEPSLSM